MRKGRQQFSIKTAVSLGQAAASGQRTADSGQRTADSGQTIHSTMSQKAFICNGRSIWHWKFNRVCDYRLQSENEDFRILLRLPL